MGGGNGDKEEPEKLFDWCEEAEVCRNSREGYGAIVKFYAVKVKDKNRFAIFKNKKTFGENGLY